MSTLISQSGTEIIIPLSESKLRNLNSKIETRIEDLMSKLKIEISISTSKFQRKCDEMLSEF
jgi:predicted PilT family ATPase